MKKHKFKFLDKVKTTDNYLVGIITLVYKNKRYKCSNMYVVWFPWIDRRQYMMEKDLISASYYEWYKERTCITNAFVKKKRDIRLKRGSKAGYL